MSEYTLARLPKTGLAHVYKLPPRPDARGWQCQAWPKENHIFTGVVRIVACGEAVTIRLEATDTGKLFAHWIRMGSHLLVRPIFANLQSYHEVPRCERV